MAIDESGEWWVGSEPADVHEYLEVFTRSEDAAYPATAYAHVQCKCGSDQFRLERAASVTRRTCAACGQSSYICRQAEDWEEGEEEEGAESYACIECQSERANLVIGFAGYEEDPQLDAVKWFYVGVRCARCGILGCFNDGKIGWGPVSEVHKRV